MTTLPAPSRTLALLGAALAMAAVGSSVAVSGVLVDAPFWTAQALRYAVACVLLVAVARVAGRRLHRPRGVDWAWLTGVAASGLVLFNLGLVRGAAHAEPAVIAVAVACVPLALALGSRPTVRVVAGALVVTVGAVLVAGGGRTDAAGVGWAALVLVCEVGFTLLAVPVLRRHGPFGVSVHTCAIAAAVFAGVGLAVEGPAAVTVLRPDHLAAVAHLAVVITAAFVLWYSCVGRVGPGRTGLLTGVAPVAAAAVGMALGGPAPGPAVWLGVAAVAAGLTIGLRPGEDLPQSGHDRPNQRADRQTRAEFAVPHAEFAVPHAEFGVPHVELGVPDVELGVPDVHAAEVSPRRPRGR